MADEVFADMAGLVSPEEAARNLALVLRGVLRAVGGEVQLPASWVDDHGDVVLSRPLDDGAVRIWLAPRVREDDERVPAGGWIQVATGTVVHVAGIAHSGEVIVTHRKGEAGQHRADEPVEEFLKRHARADAVPLIGGGSDG